MDSETVEWGTTAAELFGSAALFETVPDGAGEGSGRRPRLGEREPVGWPEPPFERLS